MGASEPETVIKFPIKTKLICFECGSPGEGSCRCGASYFSPTDNKEQRKKMAERLYKQGLTMDAIATKLGVSQQQISKDLSSLPQSSKPPRPKGGRPKGRTKPRKPRTETQQERIADNLLTEGKNVKEIASALGVGVRRADLIIDAVRVRQTEQAKIDVSSLSASAQQRLEAVKRVIEHKLTAAHAERMRRLDEEVRQRVLKEGKEYVERMQAMEMKAWEDEKHWRKMVNDHKPLFTVEHFKVILMCLHPDGERTADRLSYAFRLFNGKKLQLTGEK